MNCNSNLVKEVLDAVHLFIGSLFVLFEQSILVHLFESIHFIRIHSVDMFFILNKFLGASFLTHL